MDSDDDEARKVAAEKFAPFIKKIVNDVSVPALESGLQAVQVWVDKASFDHGAKEHAEEIMVALLKKGYSGRPATKAAADAITMLLVECSGVESVMTHLIAGTQSNVPKIAQACANLLVQLLRDFGPGVLTFDKMQKALPKILAHVNNGVRKEAMDLAQELYRWMGAIFTNHLKSLALKSSQQTELDALFEKTETGKARPVKFVRSEAGKVAAGGKKGGKGGADAPFDPLSLIKPVDIASKLSKGWIEKVTAAPKWQEKKLCLNELQSLAEATAKIEVSPQLVDVIGALKKALKDSNVVIVGDALKCILALAKGTKRGFYTYARQIFPTFIALLKEKKSNVSVPLQACLDGFAEMGVVEIPEVLEPLLEGLGDKVSHVRIQVCQYLQRWFALPRITEKSLKGSKEDATKPLAEALSKVLNDAEVEVRNVGTAALAELVATVGRKPLLEILKKLEQAEVKRYQKLEQLIAASAKNAAGAAAASSSCAEAAAPAADEEAAAAPAKAAAKAKSLPPKRPAGEDEKKPAAASSSSSSASAAAAAAPKPVAKRPASGTGLGKPTRVERPGSSSTLPNLAAESASVAAENSNGQIKRIDLAAKATRLKRDEKRIKGNFREWSKEEINEMTEALRLVVSDDLHALLFHKDFSKHIAAIDVLEAEVESNTAAVHGCSDLLFKWLSWRLEAANTSLLIKVLAFLNTLFTSLRTAGYKLGDGEASNILPFLIEKTFGHNTDRFREETRELLEILNEIYAPKAVMAALQVGFESKNKKVQSECLKESGNLIVKYGVSVCPDPKKILLYVANAVGASESHVRSAALGALGAVYSSIGEGIWTYLGAKLNNTKIPPKTMSMIEERFKRLHPGVAPAGASEQAAAASAAAPASSSSSSSSHAASSTVVSAAAQLLARKAELTSTPRRATIGVGKEPKRSPGASPASRSAQVSPRSSVSGPAGLQRKSAATGLRVGNPSSSSAPTSAVESAHNTSLPNCFSLDPLDGPSAYVTELSHQVSRTAPNSPGRGGKVRSSAASANTSPIGKAVGPASGSGAAGGVFSKALGKPQLVVPSKSGGSSASSDPALVEQLLHYMDSSYSKHLSDEEKMDVMRQLWEIVMSSHALILPECDAIVAFLTRQIEVSFTESADAKQISVNHRHCRYALNTLLEIFKVEDLAQNIKGPSLEHLTRLLLLKLMDDRLKQHADPQCRSLTMAVNVLVLKVLENSDRTAVFHMLIKFLATPEHEPVNKTFVDLVVRSLMKMVKNLSQEKFLAGLNIGLLVRDIHEFWTAHAAQIAATTAAGAPAPADDLPIKAIKAMLSGLATVKGEEIRKELPKDLPASASLAINYIEKMVEYNKKQKAAGAAGTAAPAASPAATVAPPKASPVAAAPASVSVSAPGGPPVARRLVLDEDESVGVENDASSHNRQPSLAILDVSKSSATPSGGVRAPTPSSSAADPAAPLDPIQQMLADIVARTIKPATTQTALRELHDFTQQHPHIDIWPAFHLQGDAFKSYVKRNLTRMSTDLGSKPGLTQSAPTPVATPTPEATTPTAASTPAHSRSVSLAETPTAAQLAAGGAASSASSTALYRARLSVLQDRAKIATSAQSATPAPASAGVAPSSASSTATAPAALPHAVSMSSIDAIRARFKSARSDENIAPSDPLAPPAAVSVGGAANASAATSAPAVAALATSNTNVHPPASSTASSIDAIKARIAAMNSKAPAAQ